MNAATGLSAAWADTTIWPAGRRSPFVVILAGIDSSDIVEAALADTALTASVVPKFEPSRTPPCDALLWRLETASGLPLNHPMFMRRYWHRRPYAVTVRLARYQPGSAEPEILDEGTLGTRGRRHAFRAALDRLAMRFVRDAALDRGRGPAGCSPADHCHGLPGWLDAMREKWRDRLMAEWWSIGSGSASLDQVLSGGILGDISWHAPKAGHRYLADPFPWPGTNKILCEEMPLTNGVGRIVAIEAGSESTVLLDDGVHHSYPCTFPDGEINYCVPESTGRGATRIYRLGEDGGLAAVCDPAPHARLADPTLFRWSGTYWLACTDLDLGDHDNLCLLHASSIAGPWKPHAKWPVKIDVRGARSAGMVFNVDGQLFRPGQDCAATYGAQIRLHKVAVLTVADFRESVVCVLAPDRSGPFPHGLHTLVHDGEQFWVDGKRFVLSLGVFRNKILGRLFSRIGKDLGCP